MNYLDRPLVVELAQLALDAYNSPTEDNLRQNEFNQIWAKVDEWPRKDDFTRTVGVGKTTDYDQYTGFYASFYENIATGVGVIAIRGTDSTLDDIVDIEYVSNKAFAQYEEAISFFHTVKNHYLFSGIQKIYVCGHSLGGILAKMVAPITGYDTIAFNSPGVREYLDLRHLPTHYSGIKATPYKDAFDRQQIITYCARADTIGNLRHDNDLGSYKFVDVKGGQQIPAEVLWVKLANRGLTIPTFCL